ncbi:MAG: hypothetical protein II682_01495, partial [Firmicutes bacterium]|nr:hypothetical protein [Bacillota bacterium]
KAGAFPLLLCDLPPQRKRAAFPENLRPSGHGTPHTLPGGGAVGRKDRKQFFFIVYYYLIRMDSSTEKIYAFTGIISFIIDFNCLHGKIFIAT